MESKPQSRAIFDESDFPMSLVRRTIFAGTGHDLNELARKPLIAVASSATEMNPGHKHLHELCECVKQGVWSAGGAPFSFNVPAPCDGIAMGHEGMRYVLAQRDLIADLTETHIRSMRFDAVVFIASCDKIVPGMILSAARLDLPAIFVTGGPGSFSIRFSPRFTGSIAHRDYNDLNDKLSCATCATCGACEVMGTANTFQCLAEALGLTLPGTAAIPAFHADKQVAARRSGERIVALVREGFTARKALTEKAVRNALMTDLALGGSTNATLHLPAIADAIGMELPLSLFNQYNEKIPTICAIAPNGPHGLLDLFRAGGVPAVMKRIAGDLHRDALCVTGQKMGDILDAAAVADPEVIPDRSRPHAPQGGTVVLFGTLAPEGSVVKQSAVAADMKTFSGPAAVFESEADCLTAIREKKVNEGVVLVIRNEGPKGGPGMPEMLAVTLALDLYGFKRVALVTDGRFSGATSGPCIGHVSPEAFSGGPIALVRDGDVIAIDIPGRSLELRVPENELARRRQEWKPVVRDIPPGYMERYRRHVTGAHRGAVLT
ncbi:MAG: dihydroxy-acid dehydratase [Thermodesulfobacteriota bacterium]